VAVAEWSGRVFVATRSTTAQADTSMTTGRVSVPDAHRGVVLRTLPLSGDPVAVAVDERVERAMIVRPCRHQHHAAAPTPICSLSSAAR
jgi:hypothetical protein